MTTTPSRSSKKSASAFRTIGEVATELGVAQHVLRFWETKFPHVKPHKRRGGHRYYRPQDIDNLKEIKALLHEKGYTIKGAQKHLSNREKDGKTAGQIEMFPGQAKHANTNQVGSRLSQEDIAKLTEVFNELCALKSLLSEHS